MSEAVTTFPGQTLVRPLSLRRRITDHVMTGAAVLTVVIVLAPLVAIFGYVVYRGVGAINRSELEQASTLLSLAAIAWEA